jgi:hypothetical protein
MGITMNLVHANTLIDRTVTRLYRMAQLWTRDQQGENRLQSEYSTHLRPFC